MAGLSLRLEPGAFLGLLGRNGAVMPEELA